VTALLLQDGERICDDGGGRRARLAKNAPRVPLADPVTRAALQVRKAQRALDRARAGERLLELTVDGLRVRCNLAGQMLAYLAVAEGRLAAAEWRMREAVLEMTWGHTAFRCLLEMRFKRETVIEYRRELKKSRRAHGPPVLHVVGPAHAGAA